MKGKIIYSIITIFFIFSFLTLSADSHEVKNYIYSNSVNSKYYYPYISYFGNLLEIIDNNFDCSNITVAVIDSGVNITNPDLKNNIWKNSEEICNNSIDDDKNGYIDDCHGWNFIENNNQIFDYLLIQNESKGGAHGNIVAEIIGAEHNGIGLEGICSKIKILPLTIQALIGENTLFFEKNILLKALDYAINKNVNIINMSIYPLSVDNYKGYSWITESFFDNFQGELIDDNVTKTFQSFLKIISKDFSYKNIFFYSNYDLYERFKKAEKKGIPIVFGSGNDYTDLIETGDFVWFNLKNYLNNVFAVAGVQPYTLEIGENHDMRFSTFDCGMSVDVGFYPGYYLGYNDLQNNYAEFLVGDSFAIPVITGLISILKQKYPDITFDEIRARLYNASIIPENYNLYMDVSGAGGILNPLKIFEKPERPFLFQFKLEQLQDNYTMKLSDFYYKIIPQFLDKNGNVEKDKNGESKYYSLYKQIFLNNKDYSAKEWQKILKQQLYKEYNNNKKDITHYLRIYLSLKPLYPKLGSLITFRGFNLTEDTIFKDVDGNIIKPVNINIEKQTVTVKIDKSPIYTIYPVNKFGRGNTMFFYVIDDNKDNKSLFEEKIIFKKGWNLVGGGYGFSMIGNPDFISPIKFFYKRENETDKEYFNKLNNYLMDINNATKTIYFDLYSIGVKFVWLFKNNSWKVIPVNGDKNLISILKKYNLYYEDNNTSSDYPAFFEEKGGFWLYIEKDSILNGEYFNKTGWHNQFSTIFNYSIYIDILDYLTEFGIDYFKKYKWRIISGPRKNVELESLFWLINKKVRYLGSLTIFTFWEWDNSLKMWRVNSNNLLIKELIKKYNIPILKELKFLKGYFVNAY